MYCHLCLIPRRSGDVLKKYKGKYQKLRDPGEGYYEFAKDLGLYTSGDDIGFWAKEVKWLHQYWSEH
jgi:hypothetical protein